MKLTDDTILFLAAFVLVGCFLTYTMFAMFGHQVSTQEAIYKVLTTSEVVNE